MTVVWLLEKSNVTADRLAPAIIGAFPIRMIASIESLFCLGKILKAKEAPKLIVVNENDFKESEVSSVREAFLTSKVIASGAQESLVSVADLPFKISQLIEDDPIKCSFFIDFEAMSLVMPDQDNRISLSHKEAKIIKALMESEGQEISRDRLLSNVWGDVKVARSTVDSQISRLRKKLISTFIVIESVYGGGYKLNYY